MPDATATTSDCAGFGNDFDSNNEDCQGCKIQYPAEYAACKVLTEQKQAQGHAVSEDQADLVQEEAAAEAEAEESQPESEPKKAKPAPVTPKKQRRIETFAKILKRGGKYKPAGFAKLVAAQASKSYDERTTLMFITQWLKLLTLLGFVEKFDDGKYKLIDEMIGRIQ